jgi:Holliday junction resolvase RusA-like endonuclease
MDHIRIELPGKAVPATSLKGKFRWLPKRQKAACERIRAAARRAMEGREPFTGPVALSLFEYRAIPKSWSKQKRADAVIGHIVPANTPDLKNILWLAEDAMTGTVYVDDKQITDYYKVSKRYSNDPKLIIVVTAA